MMNKIFLHKDKWYIYNWLVYYGVSKKKKQPKPNILLKDVTFLCTPFSIVCPLVLESYRSL